MGTVTHITTNETMRDDLTRSLLRNGRAYAGFTWGEFQRAMEAFGVRSDDKLASIEFGISQMGSGWLTFDRDEDGAVEIREAHRG